MVNMVLKAVTNTAIIVSTRIETTITPLILTISTLGMPYAVMVVVILTIMGMKCRNDMIIAPITMLEVELLPCLDSMSIHAKNMRRRNNSSIASNKFIGNVICTSIGIHRLPHRSTLDITTLVRYLHYQYPSHRLPIDQSKIIMLIVVNEVPRIPKRFSWARQARIIALLAKLMVGMI